MDESTQEDVLRIQEQTQDNRNEWYSLTARFWYPPIGPLRLAASACCDEDVMGGLSAK